MLLLHSLKLSNLIQSKWIWNFLNLFINFQKIINLYVTIIVLYSQFNCLEYHTFSIDLSIFYEGILSIYLSQIAIINFFFLKNLHFQSTVRNNIPSVVWGCEIHYFEFFHIMMRPS